MESVKTTISEVTALVGELFLRGGQAVAIRVDSDLLATGVCDSMGLVSLAEEIQSRYGISIKDQEISRLNLGSIQRIVQFLSKKGVQVVE